MGEGGVREWVGRGYDLILDDTAWLQRHTAVCCHIYVSSHCITIDSLTLHTNGHTHTHTHTHTDTRTHISTISSWPLPLVCRLPCLDYHANLISLFVSFSLPPFSLPPSPPLSLSLSLSLCLCLCVSRPLPGPAVVAMQMEGVLP